MSSAQIATSGEPVAEIGVLLPAYNEADNLGTVVDELAGVLSQHWRAWRILVVDDGSTDSTPDVCKDLQARHPEFSYVRLRRNFGKSEALRVGFDRVAGDLVALMDADGQDDPAELPLMVQQIEAGADLVTGRRSVRNDRLVKRTTSRLYNWTTSTVSGVAGRDFNSGFKVMRRAVIGSLEMYGELHRYIPVLAAWSGFRVREVGVNHRTRLSGRSKFGRSRFWRGFLDLLTVKFLTTYDTRPFHLIGGLGVLLGLIGSGLLTWMGIEKLLGRGVGQRPALIIGVLLVVVAVQLLSVGLLAELFVHMQRRRRVDPIESQG
jgi:glycosyltransferase involved in cell wall biosynthesis